MNTNGAAPVPPDFHGFCLRCYYDLRGLPEPRCPECGRLFNPADPRTYSPTPSAERVHKLLHKTATSLMDSLQFLNPKDPEVLRRASVERRLGDLARENADLRLFVDLLAGLLVEKGVMRHEELLDILRNVQEASAAPMADIVDDTADNPEAEPSSDLLELGQAAGGGPEEK